MKRQCERVLASKRLLLSSPQKSELLKSHVITETMLDLSLFIKCNKWRKLHKSAKMYGILATDGLTC